MMLDAQMCATVERLHMHMAKSVAFEYDIGVQLSCTTPGDYIIIPFVRKASMKHEELELHEKGTSVGRWRMSMSVSICL
jgi:hypothetical protein